MLLRSLRLAVVFAAATPALFAQTTHQPVLLISVDGMRPDYVTQADQHHLLIPTLRRILASGTHATGVNGVLPTITYPSHTTLVTGVPPAQHGILSNSRFDPDHNLDGAWYWYADRVKVPTLWSAAKDAGLHTASVSWPVTVDSTVIDYNLPEYWRGNLGDTANEDDQLLDNAISRPDGEVRRIAERTGRPYMNGNDTSLDGDETRTVYSLDILKQHRPEFMSIHLSSLDEEEHLHGPFSAEANKDLEGIDAMIDRLIKQELANYPNAVVAVVSDHGFAHVEHAVNLYIPFVKAGLIKTENDKIVSWQAQPWATGCVMPVLLHDPTDEATKAKVKALLDKLAADPKNGIETILDHQQIAAAGGFPDAAYLVSFRIGYCSGTNLSGQLVVDSPLKGAHGYNIAKVPEMRSSLFLTGVGIAQGKDLGLVDMLQIAPTIAKILGVSLSTAKQSALDIH
ncbi:alkaline phosphatase family protein [Granulicella paludicola]|jgi:predicted AlkP superfamily pyrophosphatase or phosphodiesterase|uniref:alkaline phosphatase family protein n=1 Tax=Granulicella paludicola TaxID=474951 RepID=UPI0021DFE70A|nr:ectonucleotide pyrophosphatase/phosphodiesterase [Granulicella paludicola]